MIIFIGLMFVVMALQSVPEDKSLYPIKSKSTKIQGAHWLIGETCTEAKKQLGQPSRSNEYHNKHGSEHQWIYSDGTTVYCEGNTVTGVQIFSK